MYKTLIPKKYSANTLKVFNSTKFEKIIIVYLLTNKKILNLLKAAYT